MSKPFTKISLQPFAVAGGSQAFWPSATIIGNEFVANPANTVVSFPLQSDQYSLIAKPLWNIPIVWQSELDRDYQELGTALKELVELDEGDEWKIDESVHQTACYVAAELSARSIPAPRLFNHGSRSVVFNWSRGEDNLYLTISSDYVSALISSPQQIKRRMEFPTKYLLDSTVVVRGLLAPTYGQALVPKTSSTSEASDFER